MKMKLTFILIFAFAVLGKSQDSTAIADAELMAMYAFYADSLVNTFEYQYGSVDLSNGLAELNVPDGYKYLDPANSSIVLSTLWGNPPSTNLGMLFPKDVSPIDSNFTFAIEISYDNEGFIKDDDAKDLDYDDLLETMQSDAKASNDQRIAEGYGSVELVGWASPPHYDEVGKKLHWAKELKFDGTELNTLNYNIRILGRKGYLNLNAIGDMPILPLFKKDIDLVLGSVDFKEGNKYSNFNPSLDKVAAVGIGGLIAGKVLAKAGIFAIILKFGKFILIGIVGLFSVFKGKLFGKKDDKNA